MSWDFEKKVEIASLCFAGLGLILTGAGTFFAGYQTYQLNQSLKTPYLTNLQERQIDACSGYLQASFYFTVEYEPSGWTITPEYQSMKREDWRYEYEVMTGEDIFNHMLSDTALGDIEALSQATGQLSAFVKEETRKEIETVISQLNLANARDNSALALYEAPDDETDEGKEQRRNKREDLFRMAREDKTAAVKGIKQIQTKCRDVMTGERTGLF